MSGEKTIVWRGSVTDLATDLRGDIPRKDLIKLVNILSGGSDPPDDDSPFIGLGNAVGRLVAEKNVAYGSSFAKAGDYLRLIYPDGIKPEQYTDALGLVRVFDKSMRIANRKDAFGENPWRDIAGYGLLGMANDEKEKP